jgi:hypothetical protein
MSPSGPQSGHAEALIDDRLRKTRRQVRGVDIAAAGLTLAVGVLAFLFAAAMADHWLVAGGLGFWQRLLLLVVLCSAAGCYFFRRLLPPLVERINPIFVAHTIEDSRPSLKNSLVNLLLLRRSRPDVAPAVYDALERRAAADLEGVSPEAAVDRKHVIRLAVVLTVLVAIGGLYHVLSPKSPLVSAVRVVWPWAPIDAPTRVTFGEITPGDAVAFHGQKITVSVEVHGTGRDEPVLLYYTTADAQSVDQAVPMTVPEDGYRHQCQLPPGGPEFGLQQDIEYYIAAGDRVSRRFRITVQTTPAIVVDAVEYDYPDYTGIADRTIRRQGDIRAIEGTRITIHATANTRIERAEIDLDCDALRGLTMKSPDKKKDGKKATGQFTLRLDRDNASRPEHDCYQLRFTDAAGRENRRPIRHAIEVIADRLPEIHLVDPPSENVQLPENGKLTLKVHAADPDFALRRVSVRAVCGGKSLPIEPLLDRRSPEPPHQGSFEGAYDFEPARLSLKAGDQVIYWAEAEDNKTPVPGRSRTTQRTITIVAPDHRQPPQQQPGQDEKEPQSQDNQPPEKQDPAQQQEQQQEEQQQEGQQQEGQQQQQKPGDDQQEPRQDQPGQEQESSQPPPDGESGESGQEQKPSGGKDDKASGLEDRGEGSRGGRPAEPLDGETNPGDVFDEVLKHRDEQQHDQEQPGQEQPDGEDKRSGTTEDTEGTEEGEGQREGQEKRSGEDGDDTPSPHGMNKPGQGMNKPGEKTTPDTDPTPRDDNPPAESPSTSDHQSDSQSDTEGDRSGDGQPGGGQHADRPGTGTAGSSTESEQGASRGQQQGEGETGPGAGDEVEAARPTGQSEGEREGPGSAAQPKPAGGASGRASPDPADPTDRDDGSPGRPGGSDDGKGKIQGETRERPNAHRGGNPTTGGAAGDQPEVDPNEDRDEPGGDKANLDYANRATDLALEYLKDQLAKEKPDDKLLDRLGGWNREDLAKFVRRWEKIKHAAGREGPGGEAAQRKLDSALRSLGLRPPAAEIRGGGTPSDQLRRVRQSRRIAPPPDWQEQIRAYRRGVAEGG